MGRARDLSRPWGFLSSYKLAQQVVSRTRHRGEGERDEGEPGSRATGSNLHEEKGTKETRRCRRSLRRDKRSEGDKNVERRKGERQRERKKCSPSLLCRAVLPYQYRSGDTRSGSCSLISKADLLSSLYTLEEY